MNRGRLCRFAPFLLALVVSLVVPRAVAATDAEGRRAPEIARAMFEAMNTGDLDALISFNEVFRSPEQLAEQAAEERARSLLNAVDQLGELTIDEVVSESLDRAVYLVSSSKIPMKLECTIEAEGGYLARMRLQPAGRKAVETDWLDEPADSLRDLLERGLEETEAPAIAAAVMQDGELVAIEVVGIRTLSGGEPVEQDDAFHIGSITKSMTSTVIGKLVEEEKLGFDDTLADLFPDLDVTDDFRGVTVTDLLRHRAGVRAMTSPEPEIERTVEPYLGDAQVARAEFTKAVLTAPPTFEPGTMNYSNGGYGILSHIAERVSGESWDALMERVIFGPLKFERGGIGWPDPDGSVSQPRGHLDQGGGLMSIPYGIYELKAHIEASGDAHCTIRDLVMYGDAHRRALAGEPTILSPDTARVLHTPPMGGNYACGWTVGEVEGLGRVHEHNGSAGTFFAQLRIMPDRGRVVAVATNIGLEGRVVVEGLIERLASGD
ncbi:MAG: serine hydrolase domain-containing protein [Planctomycetota bacterium]